MATSNVRVLGRNFKIIPHKREDLAGLCDRSGGTISVSTDQDAFSIKDTMLHEIMHAILHQQGYSHPYKLEESFVRPLATGIITVLQDNPQLAKWLISKAK